MNDRHPTTQPAKQLAKFQTHITAAENHEVCRHRSKFHDGCAIQKRDILQSFKRSEEHTSELQSHSDLVCRLLLEKKKNRVTMLSIKNARMEDIEQLINRCSLRPTGTRHPSLAPNA